MPRPFSWHQLHASPATDDASVDPRRRLRLCLWAFLILVGVIFGRVIQLEVSQGAAFRHEAAKPLVRQESLLGVRGRILARNGTVLAYDKQTLALAVHYRYLEEPPNPQWLRSTARARLSRQERKDPQRLTAEMARVRADRAEMARRLARLCGLSPDLWQRRSAAIQTRVQRISETVDRRRQDRSRRRAEAKTDQPKSAANRSWPAQVADFIREFLEASMEEPEETRLVIAEELDYHIMAEDLPLNVVAELETHPETYPGVKLLGQRRRVYPAGALASHVLGHLGPIQPDELGETSDYRPGDRVGRTGLERQYEGLLHGRRGLGVDLMDHSGRLVQSRHQQDPGVGRELVLTLDPALQQTAEALLDDAIQRRNLQDEQASPAGGAVVVLNAHSGAILAAASAPRFDPNLFSGGPDNQIDSVLHDPAHPLIDRTTKMAIAPGSVFKIVTALAILQSSSIDPEAPFLCRGYLYQPDSWRCALYRRQGIGHGDVTLAGALAQSCNVYFLHHALQIGAGPLVDWAERLGIGSPTGIDLPDESTGTLPAPQSIAALENHPWRKTDTLALSIGQGSLQVTPMQVARLLAAVANGGSLVTPHLVSGLALPQLADGQSTAELDRSDDPIRVPPPAPIPDLRPATLAALREGLRRAVADPEGTAHPGLWMEAIPTAGKTGTAETDDDAGDHAWFAGFVPIDHPKIVLVVALEHAGNADEAAVPVAKRIVLRLQQLGYLNTR